MGRSRDLGRATPTRAGYVHNLIVARTLGGQGLGIGLLQWAEDYVTESGRSLTRLDCGAQNRGLRVLYESVGYQWVREEEEEEEEEEGGRSGTYAWLDPDLRSPSTRRSYEAVAHLILPRKAPNPGELPEIIRSLLRTHNVCRIPLGCWAPHSCRSGAARHGQAPFARDAPRAGVSWQGSSARLRQSGTIGGWSLIVGRAAPPSRTE